MHVLARRGGADVAFVGSSMVNAAADPVAITRALAGRRPAFNAALNGAGLEAMDFWTLHVVVPLLHPRVVVIGVSSREFNDLASEPARFATTMFKSSAARSLSGTASMKERLYDWAGKVSALVRYREVLRDPLGASGGRARKALAVSPLGVLASLRVFLRGTYAIPDSFRGRVVHQTIVPFAIRGRQVAVLSHLVRTLAADHIVPVIVKMPMSHDVIALHEHGAVDFAAYESALGRFVAAHPAARFIDMAAEFSSTDEFHDPFHLNSRGRHRFSTIIAQQLKAF